MTIFFCIEIFLLPYLCRKRKLFEASPSGGILIAAAQRHGQRPGAADGRVAGLGAGGARPRAGPGAAGGVGCAGDGDGPMGAPRMRQKKGKKGCLTWEVLWWRYSETGICMYLYVFVIDMTKLWIYIYIYGYMKMFVICYYMFGSSRCIYIYIYRYIHSTVVKNRFLHQF